MFSTLLSKSANTKSLINDAKLIEFNSRVSSNWEANSLTLIFFLYANLQNSFQNLSSRLTDVRCPFRVSDRFFGFVDIYFIGNAIFV